MSSITALLRREVVKCSKSSYMIYCTYCEKSPAVQNVRQDCEVKVDHVLKGLKAQLLFGMMALQDFRTSCLSMMVPILFLTLFEGWFALFAMRS